MAKDEKKNNYYDIASAPSPGLILFNSEDQSDIIFIVAHDYNNSCSDKWRFPAHSFIIQDSSPFFQSLVEQLTKKETSKDNDNTASSPPSTNQKPIINIQCRPEIFHMLMSFIYTKEVKLSCISNCLALLEVSVKFLLTELSGICLTFLRSHVSPCNVLEILTTLRKITSTKDELVENLLQPGKLDLNTLTYPEFDNNSDNLLNELIVKCYAALDEHAVSILSSEAVLSLDEQLLRQILSRDSLNLSSELVVFNCLNHWTIVQCQRRQMELTSENKQKLLGTNIYLVRYLTMSSENFLRGPYLSDILPDHDKEVLRTALSDPSVLLPLHMRPYRLDKPRRFVKPMAAVVPHQRLCAQIDVEPIKNLSDIDPTHLRLVVTRKSHSPFKKLLNGLGEVMICVIQLLD